MAYSLPDSYVHGILQGIFPVMQATRIQEGNEHPLQYSCLVGYRSRDGKELDTIKQLILSLSKTGVQLPFQPAFQLRIKTSE